MNEEPYTVLQAGQYGLPQNRRRFFLLAAGPGERLPHFLRPTHVFPGGVSAPHTTVTVRDAISDLPDVFHSSYQSEPQSVYQRLLRRGSSQVRAHSAKTFPPLTQKRIELIPRFPGSDWLVPAAPAARRKRFLHLRHLQVKEYLVLLFY